MEHPVDSDEREDGMYATKSAVGLSDYHQGYGHDLETLALMPSADLTSASVDITQARRGWPSALAVVTRSWRG